MTKTISIKLGGAFAAITLLGMGVSLPASAQSSVPNTPSNQGLQQQSAPSQDSLNTQTQEGTLQENNGQSTLDQTRQVPLGVVSDPRQTTPEVVVQPSSTLKTDITKSGSSSTWIIALVLAILAAGAVALWYYLRSKQVRQPSPNAPIKSVAVPKTKPKTEPKPEPIKKAAKPKGKKQTRKKRKQTKKPN